MSTTIKVYDKKLAWRYLPAGASTEPRGCKPPHREGRPPRRLDWQLDWRAGEYPSDMLAASAVATPPPPPPHFLTAHVPWHPCQRQRRRRRQLSGFWPELRHRLRAVLRPLCGCRAPPLMMPAARRGPACGLRVLGRMVRLGEHFSGSILLAYAHQI